jgi:glycosyltransferase involved in cell wall biosynthesis
MIPKILYTHNVFAFQAYGGISRYFVEIIKRIPPEAAEIQIFAGFHINEYLRDLPGVIGIKVPSFSRRGWIRILLNALMQITRMNLNELAQRVFLRPDDRTIIHVSYYTRPPMKRKAKLVVTVYDMIHELFPQYFPRYDKTTYLKRLCCEEADKIIAISNCTKKDLVSLFGIEPGKIEVVYLGNSLDNVAPTGLSPGFNTPYLLYVGHRRGYKNFNHLVEAFARSPQLRNHFVLVCFGGGAFAPWEKMKLNGLGITHQVYYIEGDDRLFANYYKHARAFICPSLYEGFGLPLIEAMGLGCPVICSNRGPISEIVGDAGIYFDPEDIGHIQHVLETALFDDSLLQEKIKCGYQRAAMFSWDDAAKETLGVYQSLF